MAAMNRIALSWIGLLAATPASAEALDARSIMARSYEAMGGDSWAKAQSLLLEGKLVLYAPDAPEPRQTVDDYRMWRIFETDRASAHEAAGKVRIVARDGGQTLFEIASDGETSWSDKGIIPAAQAKETWANNFGFGVVRHALKPGFSLARLPDDWVMGSPVYLVRVTDPAGSSTLFGIDKADFRVRLAGFLTPKGWHVRTYDRFFTLDSPRWVQPGRVTLYYNGVKQNEVIWEKATVNPPLDPALFAPNAPLPPK